MKTWLAHALWRSWSVKNTRQPGLSSRQVASTWNEQLQERRWPACKPSVGATPEDQEVTRNMVAMLNGLDTVIRKRRRAEWRVTDQIASTPALKEQLPLFLTMLTAESFFGDGFLGHSNLKIESTAADIKDDSLQSLVLTIPSACSV